MSGMRIGNYKTVARLGQGAHSTILHIRRSEDSKPYALKVVPIGGKRRPEVPGASPARVPRCPDCWTILTS